MTNQSQESLTDQLNELIDLANKNGLYDAADHIERLRSDLLAATKGLTKEEQIIFDAIVAARHVQDFLWGKPDGSAGWEEWKRMFRKRVAKIDDVDISKPSAHIEVRKRLLQTAGLSIKSMALIDKIGCIPERKSDKPSDLPEYSKKVKESL
jgi:hypothetical protein